MQIINIQPTTEAEIKIVEQTTRLLLTESLKAFVLQYNGGIPQETMNCVHSLLNTKTDIRQELL